MIVRVFVSHCKLKRIEEFYLQTALPTLRKQKGCLLAIAAIDKDSRPPRIAMISFWKDLRALKQFTGHKYWKAKVVPEEKPLLLAEPILENLQILNIVQKKSGINNLRKFVLPQPTAKLFKDS